MTAAPGQTAFQPVTCEGSYRQHLQGVCTNDRDAIYWSWTDVLVKTDAKGHVLQQLKVASHHGDLCYHDGRVYVAVNLGKFNEAPGKADSWVYVYDADTLAEVAKYPVPEVVHGAGGMAFHKGEFYIIGGLPADIAENYVYEYDAAFKFQQRHVIASGHTDKGIQTVTFAEGAWWLGRYGKPAVLLRADENFKFTGRWKFNASLGIIGLGNGEFLIGANTKDKEHQGRLILARVDEKKGMKKAE